MDAQAKSNSDVAEVIHPRRLVELARSRIAVAGGLFLLSLLVRISFAICHPHFNSIFAVRGQPYSDGFTWTAAAIHLAQGEGLGSVYRPGFSVLLALFYVWFGYSAYIISGVQIVIGSLTGPFIYLVGERTFDRWVAAAAALFFTFDLSQLTQTPQATTEPLGLLFFGASIYALLLAGKRRRLSLILISGVLLALSNLTRPLTLFCVPFYALQLFLNEWSQSRKLLPSLLPALAFGLAVLLAMSPWLIRQRAVQGVWAVSTNLGEALYGATSPKYGTWSALGRVDADRAGVAPDPGSRYRYFVAQSWQNIRRYPDFYAKAVARSFLDFLNCFHPKVRLQNRNFPFPQWTGLIEGQKLFLLFLGVYLFCRGAQWWGRRERLRSGVFLAVSAALLILWYMMPRSGFIVLTFGIVAALWRFRSENVALLGWSILGAGLGDATFNNAILYRAVLMTDWIYTFFYFFGFCFVAEITTTFVCRSRIPSARFRVDPGATTAPGLDVQSFECRTIRILQITAGLLGIAVLASAIRLTAVNFRSRPSPTALRLNDAEKKGVIDRLRQISPAVDRAFPDTTSGAIAFVEPQTNRTGEVFKDRDTRLNHAPAAPKAAHREAVVLYEQALPINYYFPEGTDFAARDRIFKKRSVDTSIFRATRSITIFPGKIPCDVLAGPVVIVGWLEGSQIDKSWPGHVIQSIAIVPVTKKGKLDYLHAALAPTGTSGIF